MAGQVIMQGFVGFHIPVWARRLVTMLPAFAVIALGYDTTTCLIISQVVLSFALPVPLVALLLLSRRRGVMGAYALGWPGLGAAGLLTAAVVFLNAILILQSFGVDIPGLPTG
jgi:manganese transport protein